MRQRHRITIRGVVQGIGFRPFVYRLAQQLHLAGWVRNDGGGVSIEVQGDEAAVGRFVPSLRRQLPPGGRLDEVVVEPGELIAGETDFVIKDSHAQLVQRVSIAPDRYVCAACIAEMNDPHDRRHGYAFTNCTACGPRYTIVQKLPYDRPNTTMARFELCADCRAEYEDPANRRYHAEPIACPRCGPQLWWQEAGQQQLHEPPPVGVNGEAKQLAAERRRSQRALLSAQAALRSGQIVAIKGIGGFHLAVDAYHNDAVRRLREKKKRSHKPLAVMVRDLAVARTLVELDAPSEALLGAPAAPIVLAPRRADHGLAELVAPGLADLGVMLPYSPLHHLLFDQGLKALVMTSGNHSSEPITTENHEAVAQLPADGFLLHNRDIYVANDDSVLRTSDVGPLLVRRSRGFVPEPLAMPQLPELPVLALGAELKVTLATLGHGELLVGRHLGDLDNVRAADAFRDEVDRMLRFGRIEPQAIAVDQHPDLLSVQHAEQRFAQLPLVRVQHHHAHLAAVLAEHGYDGQTQAVGIILDGFGYGPDGTIWGGEVIRGTLLGYERFGHLRPVPQPGGDRAAAQPARMATSLLLEAGLGGEGVAGYDERYAQICTIASVSPLTSSAGRLFDGVAALLELAPETQDYEGQAAMQLEAIADPTQADGYPLPVDGTELDTRALIGAMLEDRAPPAVRAARFHNGLADGLVAMALATNTTLVALGGGCMVNRRLLCRLVQRLRQAGVDVIWPQRLPPGDGGLSAGQAAVAACRLATGS